MTNSMKRDTRSGFSLQTMCAAAVDSLSRDGRNRASKSRKRSRRSRHDCLFNATGGGRRRCLRTNYLGATSGRGQGP